MIIRIQILFDNFKSSIKFDVTTIIVFTSNVVKKSQFLLNAKIIEEKMKYLKKKKKKLYDS